MSRQPLYDQLFDLLRDKIKNDMDPGDALPSERELSSMYGLSRTTVRLAIDKLEKMGLVVRRHGKGTFVVDSTGSATDLALCYSFTDEMRELGKTPSARILSFGLEEATKSVSLALGIHLGSDVYHLHRLRLADGVPMLVGHSYLPAEYFPRLDRETVEERSLYDIIEKQYGQTIETATEEVRASTAGPSEAKLLDVTEGAPVLEISRIARNPEGSIIEYTRSEARADKFKFKVVHRR